MATDEELQREFLLSKIVESVPRDFLQDFWKRSFAAYADRFHLVRHEPTTLEEHRLPKLLQDRVFRMDWELKQSARSHGLLVTSRPIAENSWCFTYVVAGDVGLTQSYVPTIGEHQRQPDFVTNLL